MQPHTAVKECNMKFDIIDSDVEALKMGEILRSSVMIILRLFI